MILAIFFSFVISLGLPRKYSFFGLFKEYNYNVREKDRTGRDKYPPRTNLRTFPGELHDNVCDSVKTPF